MGKPVYLLELDVLTWPQMVRSGTPNAAGTRYGSRSLVSVNPALTYRKSAVARRSATADGVLWAVVLFYDAAGAFVSSLNVAAAAVTPGTTWSTFTAQFGAATALPIPGSATSMRPMFLLNFASTAGAMDCKEQWIELSSAPGVALNADRYFRDPDEWELFAGLPGQFMTSIEGSARPLTLRYSTGAYMTATGDTPPKTQYDARVRQPGLLRMELPGTTGGGITTSYGQIVLDNSDGALGDLAYYGLDGQPFVLRYGDDQAALSSFTTVMAGTMQQAVVDRRQVTVRLAGRDSVLDQPLARGRYLGNNALPNGLEGGAELTGQVKPVLVGIGYGLQPPCVNTTRRIYQVSDNVIGAAVTNVWDAGVALTGGANYTSQADMETNAPAAGAYRAWPAGGYFRLGADPTGVVTCTADATETSFGSGDWWWKALWRMASNAGLASGEIQYAIGDNFSQPDNWGGASWPTDQPTMGVWVDDARTTVRQAMSQISSSMGAWFGFIHWGGSPGNVMKFGAEVFPGPTGPLYPAGWPSFDASNLLALTGIADPGEGRGVPAWSMELGYAQNNTVYTPNMAPSVSPLALGALAIRNRRLQTTDTAVQSKNTTARAMVRETWNADNSTAVALEATRQLELHRYTKLWFEARASMAAVLDMAYKPRLGGYVYLSTPTLKVMWQDGVTRNAGWFLVMAVELDFARSEVRMTLRQATEQSI